MQINGMNEFLSRYITRTANINQQNQQKPLAIVNPMGRSGDQLNLSNIGERLRFQGASISRWNERSAPGVKDASLSLIDESISEVGSILERMKSLTLIAQSEELTDLDRINMQMEMEELRTQLLDAARKMSAEFAGESFISQPAFMELPGDGSSLLERARDRILEGKNWNAREVFQLGGVLKEVRGSQGAHIIGDEWPEGLDIESISMKIYEPGEEAIGAGKWLITDDKSVSTVREKLEWSNTINLMDAKSAAKGTERLDNQIAALQKMRDRFAAFAASYDEANVGSMVPGNVSEDSPVAKFFSEVESLFRRIVGDLASASLPEAPEKYVMQDFEIYLTERFGYKISA